jgi:hypothetical protein
MGQRCASAFAHPTALCTSAPFAPRHGRQPLEQVTKAELRRSSRLRQRLCNSARGLDEKLRERAERSILQGDDCDRSARIG